MMNTKKFFNDHKQIMAFHGYQSFEPGEVSGEVAHEIGVKLVEELYGNRFHNLRLTVWRNLAVDIHRWIRHRLPTMYAPQKLLCSD